MTFNLILLILACGSCSYWYYRKKQGFKATSNAFLQAIEELVSSCETKDAINCWFDESKYITSRQFAELQGCYQSVSSLMREYSSIHDFSSIIGNDHIALPILNELSRSKDLPTEEERQLHNEKAREFLIKTYEQILRGNGKYPPNYSQCVACVDDDDRTLVLAGAGTGKTATIMTKTRYLIQTGKASPSQILLLAYNRDAAEEMEERISNDIGHSGSVDVKTFHAFGNFILKNQSGAKRAVSNMMDQDVIFKKFIASIIKKNLEKDFLYKESLVKYFVEYAAPIVPESKFKTNFDYTVYRASHDLTTFAQERVKSSGELLIANLLFYWQIPYAYEARYPNEIYSYKPDFLITDKPFIEDENQWKHTFNHLAPGAKSAWIEYFGIDIDGKTAPWIDADLYKAQMESKVELHKSMGTDLIQLNTADLQQGIIRDKLKNRLEELGFRIRPMSHDQFLKELFNEQSQINPRWRRLVDMIGTFLPLFKDSGLSFDELLAQAKNRGIDIDRLSAFITVFKPVFEGYEEHLHQEGLLDFSDMIVETTSIIKNGLKLPYKYVLVDEFQDLSRSRSILLQAILNQSDHAKLFAVGDDWQSIYRFSGSDTNYVSHFAETFGTATKLELDTTYRFPEELNTVSSNFVTQNPSQLRKNMHSLREMKKPCALTRDVRSCVRIPEKISPDEAEAFVNSQPMEECYANTIYHYLRQFSQKVSERNGKGNSVLLLGRNRLENMKCLKSLKSIEELKQIFPNLEIDYKTAHSAKGLEADYVIVVGNDNWVFPSQRQSDQIIESALPMNEIYPYAEERRLFYVAMTRAKRFLVLLYDGTEQSVFISELLETSSSDLLIKTGITYTHYKCPHCETSAILKMISSKGNSYYKCSDWRGCGQFFSECQKCQSPVVENERGKYCINRECDYMELRCPQCGIGFLCSRVNKARHHMFYGCSNWRDDERISCSYTCSERDAENRLNLFSKFVSDKKQ